MEITLYRDRELGSESRQLPAETYNTARILLAKCGAVNLFVPIRSMQYLAIVDDKEVVFVDSARKNQVAIAWTGFHPQQRSGLQDAVPYVARYYHSDAPRTMQRLQGEFLNALHVLRNRQPASPAASVIKLPDRPEPG